MIITIIFLLTILLTGFNLRLLNKLKKMDQQECTICLGFAVDKVTIDCGHEFCNDCINEWLLNNRTCPLCRARIQTDYSDDEDSQLDLEEEPGQEIRQIDIVDYAQAIIEQDIAAHETFFTAIELLMQHGHISRMDLERLATYLRWREEDESRIEYHGQRLVIATHANMPPELANMHVMFPEASRSHQFAMEVLHGDAIAFITMQENNALKRLYLCLKCHRHVYNQVTDFVRHFSFCQNV